MTKHIHILGIAGTFMGSLAIIAKELGYKVSGQDQKIYPPMSTQLKEKGIDITEGYDAEDLPDADEYIIGNALSRGNECVEKILNGYKPFASGAQWLGDKVLSKKWVIAISGTHGKTSTASMVAWILDQADLNPSFLIGGVTNNFKSSARYTDSPFFVIEADEYDTAFFDKRSKFIHYHSRTLVINNLEFDHADIFETIEDIDRQFKHLIRTIPSEGLIIYPENENIERLFTDGLYTPTKTSKKTNLLSTSKGSSFEIDTSQVDWELLGEHNMQNAIHAVYASHHAGVPIDTACKALESFTGVKRRLEVKYQNNNLTIYDDFAHHPTAIATTLNGLRSKVGSEEITVILEFRSNTMKMGYHKDHMGEALFDADRVMVLKPKELDWDVKASLSTANASVFSTIDEIIDQAKLIETGHIVVMSNGSFDGLIDKLIKSY